ncbi:MAG: glycosyltransferase family 2 protein [Gemmatimonadales bacterium]
MTRPVLSIVIPAYNEERFIGTLLERILALDLDPVGLDRELIVVNDCSRDRTPEIVAGFPGVRLHNQPRNLGKGAAVRAGIGLATGDYLIIQDADLEYEPADYIPMFRALTPGVDAVYGSRYMKYPERGRLVNLLTGKHPSQGWLPYLGGQSLSFVALLFTGSYISDTVTALKLFRTPLIQSLPLETSGFELDHEITARILAAGGTIHEVPIRYFPRTKAEGKKIGMRDWFVGTRTFWKYRRAGERKDARTEGGGKPG